MARQYAAVLAPAYFGLLSQPLVAAAHEGYITALPHFDLGTVEITGDSPDTCIFTPNAIGLASLAARPCHIVAYVFPDPMVDAGATDPVFTVVGLNNAATPVSQNGTASFSVPTYAPTASRKFRSGYGVSVDQAAGLPFSSITSVTINCAVDAIGMRIKLVALPLVSEFDRILGFSDHTLPSNSRDDIAVREGADPKAYNVLGDISERMLKIKAAVFNGVSGLDAYEGQLCTVMIVERRSGKVTQRNFYTRFNVKGSRDFAYGNQAAERSVESGVVDCIGILAPTT